MHVLIKNYACTKKIPSHSDIANKITSLRGAVHTLQLPMSTHWVTVQALKF